MLPFPPQLPCNEGQQELMLIPSAYSEKQVYTGDVNWLRLCLTPPAVKQSE